MSAGSFPTGLKSAARYEPVDDLCILTTYFNPAGYRRKRENYERFRRPFDAGSLRLLTVECAFGSRPFELDAAPDVLQVRAADVMWQKERLLNLALQHLPALCTKVAWLDADVLFENPAWAVEGVRLLDRLLLVQPYSVAVRLGRGALEGTGDGKMMRSFADVLASDPGAVRDGDYHHHGNTGFAWMARRGLLERHGLYDACVLGGGDHVMAHAAAGAWSQICLERTLGSETAHRAHFDRWAVPFACEVGARIGTVPGAVLHLWHGSEEGRRYLGRHRALRAFAFDPDRDLRLAPPGCWEWAQEKPGLRAWAADYFIGRREDGDGPASAKGL